MVGYVATHATSPAVRKVPYDAIKDFTPVAMVGGTRNMLVVHPSLPVSDLKGFVDYAKRKASKVTFGAGRSEERRVGKEWRWRWRGWGEGGEGARSEERART